MYLFRQPGLRSMLAMGLLALALPARAEFTAIVDRNSVATNESLRLTLSSDRRETIEAVELGALTALFNISEHSSGQFVQIINGTQKSSYNLVLTLFPRQTGNLVIPSFRSGNQATQPITIRVSQAGQTSPAGSGDGLAKLNIHSSANSVLVQQQLLVHIKLSVNLSRFANANLNGLVVPNAQVILLDTRSFNQVRNGQKWQDLTRIYAVFPQQSGPLHIEPVLFHGTVNNSGRSLLSSGRNYQLRSNTLDIQIRPPGYSDQPWLPATNLTASSRLSTYQVQPGGAITRTIRIQARNQLGELLSQPPLPSLTGVQGYLDGSERSNQPHNQGVDGTITLRQVFIPEQPGDYTLAEQRISWWNTAADRRESLTIPGHTFRVGGTVSSQSGQVPSAGAADSRVPDTPARHWQAWLAWTLGAGLLTSLLLNLYLLRRKPGRATAPPPDPTGEAECFARLCSASLAPAAWLHACNSWLDSLGAHRVSSVQGMVGLVARYASEQDKAQVDDLHKALSNWIYTDGQHPDNMRQWLDPIRHAYGYPRAMGLYNFALS